MAKKVTVSLVDDLDGSEATESVAFGLDGKDYVIDLNDSNADQLRSVLSKYIEKGDRVTGRRGRRAGGAGAPASAGGPAAKDVREWARSNGHSVPDRGRIPAEVREAYDAAH